MISFANLVCKMLAYRRLIYISLLFCLVIMAGCLPSPYFQRVETIPGYNWDYQYKPVFKFNITDTQYTYQSYLIIRHTQAYPFNNIWMLVHIKRPGDTVIHHERVNVLMAEPSGKWLGRGMDEIWEQHLYLKLSDTALIGKPGTYEVSFEQNMRVNPLPEVMNVGLRVERSGYRIKPGK